MARQTKINEYHISQRKGYNPLTLTTKRKILTQVLDIDQPASDCRKNKRQCDSQSYQSDDVMTSQEVLDDDDENINTEMDFNSSFTSTEQNKYNSISLGNSALVKCKVIKDSIHGLLEFEPACMKIIDTIQFQRLRKLKQLGVADHIFPGAHHTRFQHCLGVAHLGEKLVRHLRNSQPELGITDRDILCVKIAGLCHDLGHGPFSHVYDGVFMKRMYSSKTWSHEQGSIALFDDLIVRNNIDMYVYGLTDCDLIFIKEMIIGEPVDGNKTFIGRKLNKSFLYDIVNNTISGLDVDKIDYLVRDSTHSGVKIGFEFEMLFNSARVLPDKDSPNNRLSICFPDKLIHHVMSLFQARYNLHRTVYQHKAVQALEFMIVDILEKADNFFLIPSINGNQVKISEAVNDMGAYILINDSILDSINLSLNPKLSSAKELITRIATSRYKCIGQIPIPENYVDTSTADIAREICLLSRSNELHDTDIIVHKSHVHYGKQNKNPVDFVRFYAKNSSPNSCCFKADLSKYNYAIPSKFEENSIRVFVRNLAKKSLAKDMFRRWSMKNSCSSPYPSC